MSTNTEAARASGPQPYKQQFPSRIIFFSLFSCRRRFFFVYDSSIACQKSNDVIKRLVMILAEWGESRTKFIHESRLALRSTNTAVGLRKILSSIFHMRWGFVLPDWPIAPLLCAPPTPASGSFIKSFGCYPSCFSSIFVFVTTSLEKERTSPTPLGASPHLTIAGNFFSPYRK